MIKKDAYRLKMFMHKKAGKCATIFLQKIK